jgi:hypothetical protein
MGDRYYKLYWDDQEKAPYITINGEKVRIQLKEDRAGYFIKEEGSEVESQHLTNPFEPTGPIL